MKERKTPDGANSEDPMNDLTPGKRGKRGDAALGRDIQSKLGQQLRAYYDGLIEPTPERFADLLQRLDKPSDDKENPE